MVNHLNESMNCLFKSGNCLNKSGNRLFNQRIVYLHEPCEWTDSLQ